MKRTIVFGSIILILFAGMFFTLTGCFGGSNSAGDGSPTPSGAMLKPKPSVLPVTAATSGTESAYYTTLDIKVKNQGAEGIVLVKASVTQAGTTNTDEMPVYLTKNETEEIKLTFPLVWKGGEFSYDVQAVLP